MLFVIFYGSLLAVLPNFGKISGQNVDFVHCRSIRLFCPALQNVDFVHRGILQTQAMLGGLGNGEVIVMICKKEAVCTVVHFAASLVRGCYQAQGYLVCAPSQ